MMDRKKKIAKRIREIRGPLSQREFAKRLKVSPMAVSMYERAERVPKDEVKIKLAELCGRTVQEIFFDP